MPTQLIRPDNGARILLDSAREQAVISALRYVRRTYAVPGREYRRRPYASAWTLLATPLVVELTEIPMNKWGDDLIIEVEYAAEGYRTRMGGHREGTHFVWSVYMD